MDSDWEYWGWWKWPVFAVICLVLLPSLWIVARWAVGDGWHWDMLYKFWELYMPWTW